MDQGRSFQWKIPVSFAFPRITVGTHLPVGSTGAGHPLGSEPTGEAAFLLSSRGVSSWGFLRRQQGRTQALHRGPGTSGSRIPDRCPWGRRALASDLPPGSWTDPWTAVSDRLVVEEDAGWREPQVSSGLESAFRRLDQERPVPLREAASSVSSQARGLSLGGSGSPVFARCVCGRSHRVTVDVCHRIRLSCSVARAHTLGRPSWSPGTVARLGVRLCHPDLAAFRAPECRPAGPTEEALPGCLLNPPWTCASQTTVPCTGPCLSFGLRRLGGKQPRPAAEQALGEHGRHRAVPWHPAHGSPVSLPPDE